VWISTRTLGSAALEAALIGAVFWGAAPETSSDGSFSGLGNGWAWCAICALYGASVASLGLAVKCYWKPRSEDSNFTRLVDFMLSIVVLLFISNALRWRGPLTCADLALTFSALSSGWDADAAQPSTSAIPSAISMEEAAAQVPYPIGYIFLHMLFQHFNVLLGLYLKGPSRFITLPSYRHATVIDRMSKVWVPNAKDMPDVVEALKEAENISRAATEAPPPQIKG